jgi:hypothetical protein
MKIRHRGSDQPLLGQISQAGWMDGWMDDTQPAGKDKESRLN